MHSCLGIPSFVVLIALFLIAGCSESNQTAGNKKPEDKKPAGEKPAPAKKEITVTVVDRKGYDEVIAKHKGKVVFVDFWALWCKPCMKTFPDTVNISKKYSPMQVAVISVSMDDVSDPETKQEKQKEVLEFLKKQEAAFDNLISSYPLGTKAFEAFEIDEGVPHYKIYDRQGKVLHALSDPQEAEAKIEELLKE